MPNITLSEDVPDYFAFHDYGPAAREDDAVARVIQRDFEDGKCVVLRGWDLDYDREFFATLALDPEKALKLKSILGPGGSLDRDLLRKHVARCSTPETADRFVAEAERLLAQMLPQMGRIFKSLRVNERRVTWRMLEIINEDLHIDSYPVERHEHQARMFVNLDSVPRVWHTSHTLETLFERFGHLITDEELREFGPTAISNTLTQRVYGGIPNAGRDGQPRHVIEFLPGDIWLVESRQVSHQIVYGRRAISIDMLAEPQSMAAPEKYYLNTIEAYRRKRLEA